MAEVLIEYDIQLSGPDGKTYGARACGRVREDGLWEGWIEFEPVVGGDTVRTGRETTQPNRDDIMYWATGLSDTYLDGALMRALQPLPPVRRRVPARPLPSRTEPAFPGPATTLRPPADFFPTAVLDPFHVYAEGVDVLRSQLYALSEGQLGNIVKVYGLSTASAATIDAMRKEQLVALIMLAVEQRNAR